MLGIFLKIKARDVLDYASKISTVAILDDTIVVAGKNKDRAVEMVQKLLSELTVSEVALPHPMAKSLIVGKYGNNIAKLTSNCPGVFTSVSDDSSKMFVVSQSAKEVDEVTKTILRELEGYSFEVIKKPKFVQIFTHPLDFLADVRKWVQKFLHYFFLINPLFCRNDFLF